MKSSEYFAVEKRKNVNQSVNGVILLNKPNTELTVERIYKEKTTKNKKKWYVGQDSNIGHRRGCS